MSAAATEGPPEAKKFRIDLPTQVVVEPALCSSESPDAPAAAEGQSPAGPSSARSTNDSEISSGSVEKDDEPEPGMTGNILEMISKSLLGNAFKLDEVSRPPRLPSVPASPVPAPIPGAVAVAQSPAAQLFSEDDWSWHRNPAAAIRSGGTNKQTPVWKYFVYNKAENLSRCIIGDCTYSLKGPHTSTLACHLKKHSAEYAEFQKLKVDYTRERYGGQLPSSPSSSASGSNNSTTSNNPPAPKPQKPKKEARTDVSNFMAALRAGTPAIPGLLQNLMQNPLQMMLNPQIPTSSANVNAAQAANQVLQQAAGLTISSSGQIMQSKKWRRDERRQRELEQRLALALTTSHLTSEALANPLWKELMEAAQPKFTLNDDPQYFEQLVSTLHLRLLQSIRALLASAVWVTVLVDCIRLPPASGSDEPLVRLCVSAAFPAFVNQKYEVQVVLLAFRPLVQADNTSESVAMTIDQVLSDFDLPQEKVTRIVCSGLKQLLDDDDGCVVDKQMEPFSQRIMSCFMRFLDSNSTIDELRKSVYQMIFAFVTRPESLQALNKAAGRIVELPLSEPFPVLAEAVINIKHAIDVVALDGVTPHLTDEQWSQLRGVCNAAALFRQYANGITEGECPTVDSVVPAIKQIVHALDKDSIELGALAAQLKDVVTERLAPITDVNHEEFDGTYIQATALNPQLAVLLSEQQLSYARSAIEQELHSRQPPVSSSLGVDALLASVLTSSPDSLPLYSDLLQHAQQAQRLQQERNSQPLRDRITEAALSSYFDELLSGSPAEALFSPLRSFGNPLQTPLVFWQGCMQRCPTLASLALELLSIPTTTVTAASLLSLRGASPFQKPDPIPILSHLDKPERLDRNLLLRFNRNFIHKAY
ncbi:unnamed protein product [Cylicocyclus nassatus]|uniref:HAT C-terminal dimerisation domain-containing protein n=1 Tax=Cylicocyclus nassatus TaxID=53992 RepID=A0AA36GV21_CYLNA|nr:unnamed protein product [Cylicocyclus nassatus]